MELLYGFATLVVGWVLGLATVIMAQRVIRARDIRLEQERFAAKPPPYEVTDGEGPDAEVLFTTGDLQLAKEYRREARDAGLPARLRVNGTDRG